MALKANRVGVNPKMVDELGNLKKCENVLTVADVIDNITTRDSAKPLSANMGVDLGNRLGGVESRLKIPGVEERFFFAKENDTYGYRLTQNGAFHPFSSGSSATLGINVLEPVTTDISTYGDTEILEGGYQIDAVNNVAYINMKIKISGDKTQGTSLLGLYSAIQPKRIRVLLPTNKVSYNEQEIRANSNLTDGEEIIITGVAY